jgi:hypothetical protein
MPGLSIPLIDVNYIFYISADSSLLPHLCKE